MELEPANEICKSRGASPTAIRAKVFADLTSIPDYALVIGKTERTIWNYIAQGLPVTYIGRTPYIVLSLATKYWADRARRRTEPKRGRPRKAA